MWETDGRETEGGLEWWQFDKCEDSSWNPNAYAGDEDSISNDSDDSEFAVDEDSISSSESDHSVDEDSISSSESVILEEIESEDEVAVELDVEEQIAVESKTDGPVDKFMLRIRVIEHLKPNVYCFEKKWFIQNKKASLKQLANEILFLMPPMREDDRIDLAVDTLKSTHVQVKLEQKFDMIATFSTSTQASVQRSFSDWFLENYEWTGKVSDRVPQELLLNGFDPTLTLQKHFPIIKNGFKKINELHFTEFKKDSKEKINGVHYVGLYLGWKRKV